MSALPPSPMQCLSRFQMACGIYWGQTGCCAEVPKSGSQMVRCWPIKISTDAVRTPLKITTDNWLRPQMAAELKT